MKKISIVVPTYNEEENVIPLSEAIVSEIECSLSNYDYEILFIDNCSTDSTQKLLRQLCEKNPKIKAIFNAKILDNLILHIMDYVSLLEIVLY